MLCSEQAGMRPLTDPMPRRWTVSWPATRTVELAEFPVAGRRPARTFASEGLTMDLWGRCRTCRRWFSCPLTAQDRRAWHCPVCGSEPVALENRNGSLDAALVRIVGTTELKSR